MRATIVILLLIYGLLTDHQGLYPQNGQSSTFSAMPQERMYVHYNTSLLFVGEYLYYKAYVLNEKATKLSTLSKVAYVELVNKEMESIFKHKLFLENSTGQSDFFIPADMPSGHYKLIGYTQWMRNGNKENFFQGDISIINPYQSAQSEVLPKRGLDSIFNDNDEKQVSSKVLVQNEHSEPLFGLTLDKTRYLKREKVVLGLRKGNAGSLEGNYSLSIRKIDTIAVPSKVSAIGFTRIKHKTGSKDTSSDFWFLPELRGELISGKVLANEQNLANKDMNVVISIPEEEGFQLKVATSDSLGNFIVNLDKKYTGEKAHVQVLSDKRAKYSVTLDKTIPLNYPEMEYRGITITPSMEEMIVERSVHNQIENGYFSVKPDSLAPLPAIFPIKKEIMTTYNLDDHTRFSTIRETLVEVVDQVWTKRIGQNQSLFQILPYQYDFQLMDFPPLVLMDGIPIQDHAQLAEYNARDVQHISFLRDKYVVGPKIFQGVLNFETIDHDYVPYYMGSHGLFVDIVPPEPFKKYYQQKYDGTDTNADQLLDFRYQLLWEPNLKVNKRDVSVEFYTSDLEGDFEITLEGFANDGTPVTLTKTFNVK
ncbi:hypothetical protein MTsPCn9_31640 [Croceitalea sp. MTPC9]|uniref:hypothetical protein n=1 Tax=unclassified Croceitalea TaxID=2632280 RepID=UPI002B3F3388|nr:hypothetical protein MTsPCn6_16980 [Croceitalea sp. MTPC6]GMN18224.1 hypothetical protein MTsPCn9_31640 [Croceitalea sp. MTPC9]